MVDRQLNSAACDLDLHVEKKRKKKDGRDAHLHSQKRAKRKNVFRVSLDLSDWNRVGFYFFGTENCVSTPKKKRDERKP